MVSHHALQVSRPTPKGEVEGSGLGEGSPGPHWGGVRWISPGPHRGGRGGFLQAQPPPPTPDGYCCGRYASYWNAFLLSFVILSNKTTVFKYAMSIYLIIYGLIFHDFSL